MHGRRAWRPLVYARAEARALNSEIVQLRTAGVPLCSRAASRGPAISLCDASSTTACTELQGPGVRLLPPSAVTSPLGTVLASTGVNIGPIDSNALTLPSSYLKTGCALLAAPVSVLATGTLMGLRVGISDSSTKLANGAMLGIYADNGTFFFLQCQFAA